MMYQDAADLIRNVLLKFWDPIGIFNQIDNHTDNFLRDEYDSYIPKIYKYIVNHNYDGLVKYLEEVEIKSMGLNSCKDKHLMNVAAELFKLKISEGGK